MHERYAYIVARHAVKANLVLGRTGYDVVAQLFTRYAIERDRGVTFVTNPDRGTKTKSLAIVRHETQFCFNHFPVEVPFGMTS